MRHVGKYLFLKSEVNRLNREIKKEIRFLNQHNWNKKLASLKTEDCSLFSFTKSIKRKRSVIPPLTTILTGELAYGDKEKVELLAYSAQKTHQINACQTIHTQVFTKSVNKIQNFSVAFPKNAKTSVNEVQSPIERL